MDQTLIIGKYQGHILFDKIKTKDENHENGKKMNNDEIKKRKRNKCDTIVHYSLS